MNWRKGLSRAWIVGSLAWILAVTIVYNPIEKIADPINGGFIPYSKITTLRNAGYPDAEIVAFIQTQTAIRFGEIGLLPPALLGLCLGVWWVVLGFKRRDSN